MDKAASRQVHPFCPPLLAGVALGMALLLAVLLTGRGLGTSGFMVRLAAWLGGVHARRHAKQRVPWPSP